MSDQDKKYWAFISYSHQDKKWADWLHKHIETYKVPKSLHGIIGNDGPVPKRIFPVFKDREELASSADLNKDIQHVLRKSNYIIVICSPRSAKSKWVNEEIKYFKSINNPEHVFCLIIDGEPNASFNSDVNLEECYPDAIRYKVTSRGEITTTRIDPVAADVRKGQDGKNNALLKILAGLLGVEYDVLRQRDQTRRLKRMRYMLFAAILIIGFISFLSIGFLNAKNEALQAKAKLEKSFIRMARTLTRTFSRTLIEPILTDDRLTVMLTTHSFYKKPVGFVLVLTDEGHVFVSEGDIPDPVLHYILTMIKNSNNGAIVYDYVSNESNNRLLLVIEPVRIQESIAGYAILGFER